MTDTVHMNGMAGDATTPNKITEIKRLVDAGQYRIDPHAIADAMIRWAELDYDFLGRRTPRARSQKECSNPDNSSSVSMKLTPAVPAATIPITASPALAVGQAA
jgi:Anti-sigma-28 factor, FlgM